MKTCAECGVDTKGEGWQKLENSTAAEMGIFLCWDGAACEKRKMSRELKAWKALAQGRGLLLVAYRLQSQPKEKAFKLIDEARAVLGDRLDVD